MRRAVAALTLCVGLICGVAGPASAATGQEKQLTRGTLGGTFERDQTGVSFPQCFRIQRSGGTFDLTFTENGGRVGTLSISGCLSRTGGSGRFLQLNEGTFVFTASNGATLTGTADGLLAGGFPGLPALRLTLTVESGTKQFKSLAGDQFNLLSSDFAFSSVPFTAALSRIG